MKLPILSLVLAAVSVQAAPLKRAEVTQIFNEVAILRPGTAERPAVVNDVIQKDLGVRTGQKSRAELVFSDETLTRLGANTIFNFEGGTRDMNLSEGVMLLQVPKNAGGASIRTAAVTAAITGTTVLVEHTRAKYLPPKFVGDQRKDGEKPHGYIKVMVLEGTLKLSLRAVLGESTLIEAGKMVIMADDATKIPEPIDFDVETVFRTSKLLDPASWLRGVGTDRFSLVGKEIGEQRRLKVKGELIDTNLYIQGRGTKVLLGNQHLLAQNRLDASNPFRSEAVVPPVIVPVEKPPVVPPPPVGPTPPPVGPKPTPVPPGPNLQDDLPGFALQGSTTVTSALPPPTSPNIPGNAVFVNKISGPPDVLPTAGTSFSVFSTGGKGPSGADLTATRALQNITFSPTTQKQFLQFDYRFLTDEINTGATFPDQFTATISSSIGKIQLSIDRNIFQPGGQGSLSPIALSNIGGFAAASPWLTFKTDITPFIAGGSATVDFFIWDVGDSIVDSAVALDRFSVNGNSAAEPNSAVPGTLSISLNALTIGLDATEFTPPDLTGYENVAATGAGSSGGRLDVTTENALVVNAPILASTGRNKETAYGGTGGTVNLLSTNGTVTVNSQIRVSEQNTEGGAASAAGGKIGLTSNAASGVGIQINNSGELLALLDAAAPGPGGRISFSTVGSNIVVNGGTIIASRGTVDARSSAGSIVVNNATIRADIIKIGALGPNGSLQIGGGELSADSSLKLFAGAASGQIVFTGNTTLGGSAQNKIISANSVTVQDGVTVSVQGSNASVYTTNANYTGSGGNRSTTGTFRNGQSDGASTFSQSASPGFD